jgi:hypothetical protein
MHVADICFCPESVRVAGARHVHIIYYILATQRAIPEPHVDGELAQRDPSAAYAGSGRRAGWIRFLDGGQACARRPATAGSTLAKLDISA